ncbi:MAG: hypothetical protein PHV85_07720 [Desulfovibrionaceae bacterium]|nr:hypothetical protein [Desulfovibrionaceae bacterium]MDD4952418.1 hypothetical protein [Desulfovibrionaceae bacterium]
MNSKAVQRALVVLAISLFALQQTLAAALAGGVRYVRKWTEEDLSQRGYVYAGENFEDKFKEIKGNETTIRIYKKGQETIGLYMLPNNEIYGYAQKIGDHPLNAFIDEYNDGFCEKTLGDGDTFSIDFSSYHVRARR